MEENFNMEWNMEWKIFRMEWKWNGRKLSVWNMKNRFPFHTMPWFVDHCVCLLQLFKIFAFRLTLLFHAIKKSKFCLLVFLVI